MAHRIEAAAGGSVRGKTVAILGVTFKPNTDDMRDAPSLVIVPMLQERGGTVRVVDPQGRKQADPLLPGVVWCESALEAATGADVLVTVTEWNEFRALDLKAAKAKMRGDVLVDLRNVYSADIAHDAGFRYWAVGRKSEDVDLVTPRVALSA
jgi:UDPglucose 6-dehydrogenase